MKRNAKPHSALGRNRLSDRNFQAIGAFRLALRRFAAFSDAAALAAGLTPQQHQALLAIRAHSGAEPMAIGELAECLMIKNHSAVELVGRLIAAGLASRAPSEVDRRRVLLRLTDEGRQRLDVVTRSNLRELRSTAPIFRDLLTNLRRIGAEQGAANRPRRTRRSQR